MKILLQVVYEVTRVLWNFYLLNKYFISHNTRAWA